MKHTIWLTCALSKILGVYSRSQAEKRQAVTKKTESSSGGARGRTWAALRHGLWGKSGEAKSRGCRPSGEI